MALKLASIGYGEAASAFSGAWLAAGARVAAYDRKTDHARTRESKHDDYCRAGVEGCETLAEALAGADTAISLVTADQALAAATASAAFIEPGALWFDMNSVAPETKRRAAAGIEKAGGRYVDVAIMAPVLPRRAAVPLLLCGPHAEEGAASLRAIGFTDLRVVAGPVGAASAIKMIRSVLVKGLEALTTECFLAADVAGVAEEVRASLDASWPEVDWAAKADYNLERMIVHGERRAAEMEEVVKTLDALGTGSAMARAAAERQRAIGTLGLTPAAGLGAKIDAILGRKKDRAA